MALPQQRFPISRMRWALKLTTGEWDEESPSAPEVEKFWAALKMFLLAFPMVCTCFRSSVGGNKDAGVRQKEKGFEEILAANLTIAERIVFFSIKLIIYVKLKGIKTLFPVNMEKGGVQILYLFSCGWFNANQQTANSQPQKLEKLVSEVVWLNVCVCFFLLPTAVTSRSGWSCRNMNCLWSEVISHRTSKRLITVSASCRTCRELQPAGVSAMKELCSK